MKKILILISLLMMFSTIGFAENWIIITKSEDKNISMYVDTETIKKRNGYIYFWVLHDYKEPIRINTSAKAVASTKAYYMADCNLDREQRLDATIYSGNMGRGEPITRGDGDGWDYVIPGSMYSHIQTFVCSYFE
jgi:hypothetical protein